MPLENIAIPLGPGSQEVIVGGIPSQEELCSASASGVRIVIDLRSPCEFDLAEMRSRVEALGMGYRNIPVQGPGDLLGAAARLHQVLVTEAGPVLIHCVSGNRVGAVLALRAAHFQKQDSAEALRLGRACGLTQLEPSVTQLLERATPRAS